MRGLLEGNVYAYLLLSYCFGLKWTKATKLLRHHLLSYVSSHWAFLMEEETVSLSAVEFHWDSKSDSSMNAIELS